MGKIIKRELGIYLFLLIFLCVWMHYKELLSHPIEHFKHLPEAPFGLLHPLLFTFAVYCMILIVRVFIHFIRRLKRD